MKRQAYLLVDGYNMIGAWPHLSRLQVVNIQEARDRLIAELASYARVRQVQVIVVFDAQGLSSLECKGFLPRRTKRQTRILRGEYEPISIR